ncbi:MAG: hypothetical protein GY866_21940 [Proteobacteria bacterium]|nr:hypothetical protein [Pseudomonadota bacterium]
MMVEFDDESHYNDYEPVERCASAEAFSKRQQHVANFSDHGLPPIRGWYIDPFCRVNEYRKSLFIQGKRIGSRSLERAAGLDSFRHDRNDRIPIQFNLEVFFGDFDNLGDMQGTSGNPEYVFDDCDLGRTSISSTYFSIFFIRLFDLQQGMEREQGYVRQSTSTFWQNACGCNSFNNSIN